MDKAAPSAIFDQIRWSTADTADDQIGSLERCGIEVVVEEGVVRDVDEVEDLEALHQRLQQDQDSRERCPRTWFVLQETFAPGSNG